jgi:magnesium chelatase family protein
MPRPRAHELAAERAEPSVRVRERVIAARERLARASPAWTPEATELLDRAVERLPLSGRGRARARRVAETIAALAHAGRVEAGHLSEALAYRSPKELSAP